MRTIADVTKTLRDLGLAGGRVVVHASLRKLGPIEGGADALLDALRATFATTMMPAFWFGSNAKPLAGVRPERNGTDYTYYDGWTRPLVPFVVEATGVDAKMGVLAQRFGGAPGVVRSDHPWHSWACAGEGAEAIVRDHPWCLPNAPLARVAERAAHVLLIGVGLSACTALHLAEERAGRRPFVRWACHRDGTVRPMRVSGCAQGFEALADRCASLLVREGPFTVAPLGDLIERAAAVFRAEPHLARCSEACVRCRDASAGGPTLGPE